VVAALERGNQPSILVVGSDGYVNCLR